ncbi:MAG: DMT family transporter [Ferruginibacter sp.]
MKTKDIFLLLLLSMVWGSSSLFLKIVAPVIGVFLSVGTRMFLAALTLLVVAAVYRQLPDLKSRWKDYLILGAFNIVVPFLMATYSVIELGASLAAILGSTIPLFTALASKFFLKENITGRKLTGMLMSIAGIFMVLGWSPVTGGIGFWLAILAGLAGSFSYAFTTVFAKLKFNKTGPVDIATGQIIMAAAISLPFLFLNYQPVLFTPGILVPLTILAIINTAGGYIFYFRLIENTGTVNASLVTILVPVFSVLWASVFLNEQITAGMITGLGFVLIGIFLVVYNIKRRYISKLKPVWVNRDYKERPLKSRSRLKTAESEM